MSFPRIPITTKKNKPNKEQHRKTKQYTTINIIPYPLITLPYKSIILTNKYYLKYLSSKYLQ